MQRSTMAGLISASLVLSGFGCSGGKSDYKKTSELSKAPAAEKPHDHHEHSAKGPHGGGLIELGDDEYHAEVGLDHDAHAIWVYVLGKDAKTPAPIAAPELTLAPEGKDALTLKAAPQDGDAEGKSSKFELVDNAAVHGFLDAGLIHADLSVKIGDKVFKGHVDYHLEDEHHEHKEEGAGAKAPKVTEDPK